MAVLIGIERKHIKEVDRLLNGLEKRDMAKLVRRVLNKTATRAKTQTSKTIRQFRKIKASEVNRRLLRIRKASGNDPMRMFSSVSVSGKPLTMLRFVKGDKSPPKPKSKGISPRKRRSLRVEIVPGKTKRLVNSFVQRGRARNTVKPGNTLVFRRQTKRRLPIAAQIVPAVSRLILKPNVRAPIENKAGVFMQRETTRLLRLLMERGRL